MVSAGQMLQNSNSPCTSLTCSAVSGVGGQVETSSKLLRFESSNARHDNSIALSHLVMSLGEPSSYTGWETGKDWSIIIDYMTAFSGKSIFLYILI